MQAYNSERREQSSPAAGTMTSANLIDVIYKGEGIPQDERFFPINEGGVFKYFFPADLVKNANSTEIFYPFVKTDNKVVGLAKLEIDPKQQKVFWIKFVSLDPVYQGKGYASQLVKEIFRFAKMQDFAVQASSYSDEGNLKLKRLFKKFAEEFSVRFIDTDSKF